MRILVLGGAGYIGSHTGTSKNPLKIRSKCSAGIEIATFATTLSKHR